MQLGAARVPYGGAYTRSERWDHCNTDRLPQHLHGHSRSVPERGQGDWFGGAHLVRHGYLNVSYKRPAPIVEEATLRARIVDITDRKTLVACSIYAEDKECAQAELLAIRVPPEWLLPPS